jgi:peroxiredoxin
MPISLLIGFWLGLLQLPDAALPFQFEIALHDGTPVMIIQNADERIVCDEVTMQGDSIFIKLPLYDSEFRLKVSSYKLTGNWFNYGRKVPTTIPFSATKGITDRFTASGNPTANLSLEGSWETWFASGTPDSSLAIGKFKRDGNKVHGTFLTESGDHRYLEGIIDQDSLKLSVFDGTHAYLYLAKVNGDEMQGMYYSGNAYKTTFRSKKNNSIALRDPSTLTQAKGEIDFTLPDADSNLISLTDTKYRNYIKIVQILGTWCPNCMDESKFLDSVYTLRKDEGLAIFGLAFERSPQFSEAVKGLKKMQKRLNIHYPILLAGTHKKGDVQKVLPAIENFFSYPTTLFIDRKGNIVKIHSGFSGPATGEEWEKYKVDFNRTLDRLLR